MLKDRLLMKMSAAPPLIYDDFSDLSGTALASRNADIGGVAWVDAASPNGTPCTNGSGYAWLDSTAGANTWRTIINCGYNTGIKISGEIRLNSTASAAAIIFWSNSAGTDYYRWRISVSAANLYYKTGNLQTFTGSISADTDYPFTVTISGNTTTFVINGYTFEYTITTRPNQNYVGVGGQTYLSGHDLYKNFKVELL